MLKNNKSFAKAFSLLEIVLAVAIFAVFSTSMVGLVLQGISLNRLSAEKAVANQYASEGIEAARSIKNQSYSLLVDNSDLGLTNSAGYWAFSGVNDTFDKYTRKISITPVQRDANGNIVEAGGVADPNTKKITSVVTWSFSAGKQDSLALSTYLSNWSGDIVSSQRGGMIVYGSGGSVSDSMQFRLLDSGTWNWSEPLQVGDVDSSTTNRAMRVAKLYTSPTRIEKVLVTRHFDGSKQYIYAQTYNGADWGNSILLSTWQTSSFMSVQNFDGTYLANGDFMVAYSDNTNTPKFRTWSGSSWSSQLEMGAIPGVAPTYIVVKARPGTNEVMTAIYDQSKKVSSQYFNGNNYSSDSWVNITEHPTKSNDAGQRLIDFDWSPVDPTRGGLIYVSSTDVKSLSIRIWTADGSGSGSWSAAADTTPFKNLGVTQITGMPGEGGFMACDKDNSGNPHVVCFRSDFTPTWSYPANNILSTDTDHVIEQSFDMGVEHVSASLGLGVFSDNSGGSFPAKFKTYDTATNTWQSQASLVNTGSITTGDVKMVRIIPKANSDDMMVLIGDSNLRLFSFVWDGSTDSFYTAPAGRSFTQQGSNGANSAAFWYDFAWD